MVSGEKWHGLDGYSNHKCRCAICRDAWKEYCYSIRQTRRERIAKDPSLAIHGSSSTYTNWGCRCAECTRANTVMRQQWYAKRAAR